MLYPRPSSLALAAVLAIARCPAAPPPPPLPAPLPLGAAPYAASLRPGPSGGGACSAAVLRARWLLTAAHCVAGRRPPPEAVAGVADASGALGRGGQRRAGDRIVLHPLFKGEWAQHDVALVRLAKPFNLNQFVNVIRLSETPWGNETVQCRVPGYGVIQADSTHPLDRRLKAHAVNATRPCRCAPALAAEKGERTVAGWVCSAGGPRSGGPCRGDSGAPLVCGGGGGRLRAVTSATFYIHDPDTCDISREPTTSLCADAHVLNIFIEIHPYLDWIDRTIQSASSDATTELIPLTLLLSTIATSELLRQRGKAIFLYA